MKKESIKVALECVQESITNTETMLRQCDDRKISGGEVVAARRALVEMRAARDDIQFSLRTNNIGIAE
jgi:hypothetical protein